MSKSLIGKVAIVTGAGSGIGRASALLLAEHGAQVVVADIVLAAARETVELIAANGGQATAIAVDVSQASDVQAGVDHALETYGKLDLAHNNAGVLAHAALTDDDAEAAFDKAMAVNARGVFLSMKYEIAAMLKSGGGAVVNTASTQGMVASPYWAYAASKHACVGLTKAVAIEYAQRGIRVNAICPGGVLTPMTIGTASHLDENVRAAALYPIGRFADPVEIAQAALWLLSDASSYMNGAIVPVDGGFTAA